MKISKENVITEKLLEAIVILEKRTANIEKIVKTHNVLHGKYIKLLENSFKAAQ